MSWHTPGPWLLQGSTIYALNSAQNPANKFYATVQRGVGDDGRWFDMNTGAFGSVWYEGQWHVIRFSAERKDLIAKPWTGEGLPPVGSHAYVYDPEGLLVCGAGEDGEVIAHVENTAVIRMSYGLGCFTAKHLRTAEQIAAEEQSNWIRDFCSEMDVPLAIGKRAYDLGYRKQEQK